MVAKFAAPETGMVSLCGLGAVEHSLQNSAGFDQSCSSASVEYRHGEISPFLSLILGFERHMLLEYSAPDSPLAHAGLLAVGHLRFIKYCKHWNNPNGI